VTVVLKANINKFMANHLALSAGPASTNLLRTKKAAIPAILVTIRILSKKPLAWSAAQGHSVSPKRQHPAHSAMLDTFKTCPSSSAASSVRRGCTSQGTEQNLLKTKPV
jgi:hypothetical protein